MLYDSLPLPPLVKAIEQAQSGGSQQSEFVFEGKVLQRAFKPCFFYIVELIEVIKRSIVESTEDGELARPIFYDDLGRVIKNNQD